MFRIWGKDKMFSMEDIIDFLQNNFGITVSSSELNQAVKRGGVVIGNTKILYFK